MVEVHLASTLPHFEAKPTCRMEYTGLRDSPDQERTSALQGELEQIATGTLSSIMSKQAVSDEGICWLTVEEWRHIALGLQSGYRDWVSWFQDDEWGAIERNREATRFLLEQLPGTGS
jgi:hypothetical protein